MKISEIFYSIQGEGGLIGTPSVFIRTTGCNLRCRWCDTPYTSWQPEGEEMTLGAIMNRVGEYPALHAVVTGGEPMIAPQTAELTHLLRQAGLHITIETAGTAWADVACDLLSVSPKLSNSTPQGPFAAQHDRLRIQPAILSRLLAAYAHQVKFVIAQPSDIEEIRALVQQLGVSRQHVILMPEGIDASVLHERGKWVSELCKAEGYRYSPRLHVELYGNRRGV